MPAEPAILEGRVERITFANPENAYTVAKVQFPGLPGLTTVVGRMVGVTEGQQVRVKGRQVLHPKFGLQIEAEEVEVLAPTDAEGVWRYLASGLIKGVGPKLAQAVVNSLGPLALEVILHEPQALTKVPGIGVKKAHSIAQAVASHGQLREVMVFLQGHGVGASTALRIWRQYGEGTLGVLNNEPHRLAADVRGIGFATADAIAQRIGIAHDHPTRLMAGLLYTLGQAVEEGHCFLPYEELMDSAARNLRLDRGLLGPAFARLHNERRLVLEETPAGQAVYLTGMQVLEERAAQALAEMARRRGLLPPERAAKAAAWVADQLRVRPSPAQGQALRTLLTAGVAVLTGGPGTGKTTLVRALVTIAGRMDMTVLLASPTGRAAKRLSEAAGLPASTIHRLLEYSPKEGRFLRNAAKPLEADLLVVDESSMLDLWLAAHLLEAVGAGTRLVLVGDADQLPSVGAGLVLRQVMDSGVVPVAALSEIFRQDEAGLIVANAHRILKGQMPVLPQPGSEADFFFVKEPDPAKAAELVRRVVVERLPARFGLDPVADIQVLAPMHRGNLGCAHLNRLLREALNPGGARAGGQFAKGDKVMQVRNNYDLEAFNGDLGTVATAGEDGYRVQMGERLVDYALPDLDDLTLAYAVTVHKSQGSEYPAVVVALGQEHYIMLNRPLLYTAVTRGKMVVVLVGHPAALARAVEQDQPVRRYARLDQRLRALAAG
ncbi:MAG: ATP-dependent RecD-like DNA helicase [Desulfarculus sp.]|nr:ATP-dependent RecD-like DNA helicase [Desulfarculus sp.]